MKFVDALDALLEPVSRSALFEKTKTAYLEGNKEEQLECEVRSEPYVFEDEILKTPECPYRCDIFDDTNLRPRGQDGTCYDLPEFLARVRITYHEFCGYLYAVVLAELLEDYKRSMHPRFISAEGRENMNMPYWIDNKYRPAPVRKRFFEFTYRVTHRMAVSRVETS